MAQREKAFMLLLIITITISVLSAVRTSAASRVEVALYIPANVQLYDFSSVRAVVLNRHYASCARRYRPRSFTKSTLQRVLAKPLLVVRCAYLSVCTRTVLRQDTKSEGNQ